MAASAAGGTWGMCKKVDETTQRTDDCRQSEPMPGKERFCECCEHHRSHHETPQELVVRLGNARLATPIRSASGACGTGAVSALVRSSPRLTAKRLSLGSNPLSLKRRRDDAGEQSDAHAVVDVAEDEVAGDAAGELRKGKVKLEPGTEASPVIHKKLKPFWEKLLKEYPKAEFGEYDLKCGEDGTWMVVCKLCKDKKPKGYDTGHNFSLSNFKNQHFKSKLHMKKLGEWKEGLEKTEKKLEEQQAKRQSLVASYADRGKLVQIKPGCRKYCSYFILQQGKDQIK